MATTTMRLLAVLELLQSRAEITGAEIAQHLNVDTRSVRRYIKTLQDMAIPIEGERGCHGAYRLDRGFKLPPMMFSEEEAVALTLGLMVIRALQFPIDAVSVAGALAKIERMLPEALLNRILALQETVHFNYTNPPTAINTTVMPIIAKATQQRQRLELCYASWSGEYTERLFDPYDIVLHEGYWYLAGYCHLRKTLRTLRVDRIQGVATTEVVFARPSDFDAVAHVVKSLHNPPGIPAVEVLCLTSLEQARRSIPPELGTLEVVDEGVLFRRPGYRLEWVASMMLSLDFPIRIMQPPILKDMIRELGEKALKMIDTAAMSNRKEPHSSS